MRKNNFLNATKQKPRIREIALEKGIRYPSDHELIMMILGSGTKDIPLDELSFKVCQIIAETKNEDVIPELLKIQGIGTSKALAIASGIELGRRFANHIQAKIKAPKDILPFVKHYSLTQQEHFLAVTLSGASEIINIHTVSVGTVNFAIVHPRDVFSTAVKENASSIIICHNHPSGNCLPSDEDITTTERLMRASEIIGIPIIDHLIISQTDYFSFFEHQLLKNQ